MKQVIRLLIVAILPPALAPCVAADAPPQASTAAAATATTPDGYALYERLPLTGRISGIVQMQCGTRCSTQRATQEITGTGGAIEVWQDARITAAMRTKLWGYKGGAISFSGQPAKSALIVLRNASGAVMAQSAVDKPLADVETLFIGATIPTYLVSVDYHLGTADTALIGRGILDVDIDRRQMAFATFSGPASVPVRLPDGQTAQRAVPGAGSVIAFDNDFTLRTKPSDHTAEITITSCVPSSYIDYRTRATIDATLAVQITYQFRENAWNRQARLEYDNCGATFMPAPARAQSRN